MDDFKYTYNLDLNAISWYLPFEISGLIIAFLKKHQLYTNDININNVKDRLAELLEDGEEVIQNGKQYKIILNKNVTNDDIDTVKYVIDLLKFKMLSDIKIENNIITLNLEKDETFD